MQDNEARLYALPEQEHVSLPKRSRLYNLEPIGIGTPYTESLSGYFTRLAYAHCVAPKELAVKEVFPLVKSGCNMEHRDLNPERWLYGSSSMNGIDSIALGWVLALEKLTLRQDLRFLTMLTWKSVTSSGVRLIRRKKVWCPLCYNAWSLYRDVCYEPLLWYLEVVTECPLHHHKLYDRCSNKDCGYSPSFFESRHQSNSCPNCTLYLGNSSQDTASLSEDEQNWQWKLGNSIGELIAAAPKLPALPSLEGIALGIAYYRSKGAVNESLNSMAERLEVDPYQLWSMQSKQHAPRLEYLLRLYFLMDLPPLDFLTQTLETFTPMLLTMANTFPNVQIQDQDVTTSSKNHELMLRTILTSIENPPHMREIAKRLDCPATSLMLRFPQLYRAIVERRRRALQSENIHSVLEAALVCDRNPLPHLEDIAKQLGCSIATLQMRFPELCRSVAVRYQKRVDIDDVKKGLEKLLTSQESPPPTMKDVTEQLGWSYGSLKKYFPLLCQLINKRYKKYVKSTSFNNQQQVDTLHRGGVLEAILSDNQNPVPSLNSIARNFNCSPKTLQRYFPEQCLAIIEKRCERLDLASLQQTLEMVLSKNERPIAFSVLAQSLDVSVYTLKCHFPELCAELKKRRLFDTDEQREKLEKIVEENENITVYEFAQLVRCDQSTLYNLFPELIQIIVERHKKPINNEESSQKLEAILMDDSTIIPSIADIVKRFGCSKYYLKKHCSELYRAILNKRMHMKQIDTDSWRQSLELVLLDTTPISMKEVERHLGHSYTTIKHKYPELCEAISKRYKCHRKERGLLRIEKTCEEVKQIMLNLHLQGQYPGIILVRSLVSNSNALRIKAVYSTYHKMLKVLSYKEDYM